MVVEELVDGKHSYIFCKRLSEISWCVHHFLINKIPQIAILILDLKSYNCLFTTALLHLFTEELFLLIKNEKILGNQKLLSDEIK